MKKFFELRGELSSREKTILEIAGGIFFLSLWTIVSYLELVSPAILPMPQKVLFAFGELHFENALIRNLAVSVKLNFLGYLEAIAISLPFGFLMIFPFFRGILERYITSIRYLPLTALMGLFIAWFGIYANMKVQFLAFGIFVYLLPTVAQRVYEVQQIYVDTVKTLGASKWQTIRHVFIPDVISRVFDDIGVLVALSWTYIIIAEVVNSSDGGIGALAYIASRQSRADKVYAVLIVIMLVGFLQDKIRLAMDKKFFPHKYV